jgi:hypothetical protein
VARTLTTALPRQLLEHLTVSPTNMPVRARHSSPAMDRPTPSSSSTTAHRLVLRNLLPTTAATVRTMLKAHLRRNNALASQAASRSNNFSSALLRTRWHTRTTQSPKLKPLGLPSNGQHPLPCNQRTKAPHSKGQRMQTTLLSLKLHSMVNKPHQAGRRPTILHSLQLL